MYNNFKYSKLKFEHGWLNGTLSIKFFNFVPTLFSTAKIGKLTMKIESN